jgi:hypothetical protein
MEDSVSGLSLLKLAFAFWRRTHTVIELADDYAHTYAPFIQAAVSDVGHNYRQVAKWLTRERIPAQRGGSWAAQSVKNLVVRYCHLTGRRILNPLQDVSGASAPPQPRLKRHIRSALCRLADVHAEATNVRYVPIADVVSDPQELRKMDHRMGEGIICVDGGLPFLSAWPLPYARTFCGQRRYGLCLAACPTRSTPIRTCQHRNAGRLS